MNDTAKRRCLAGAAVMLMLAAMSAHAQGLEGFLNSARQQMESAVREMQSRPPKDSILPRADTHQDHQDHPETDTHREYASPAKDHTIAAASSGHAAFTTKDVILEIEAGYLQEVRRGGRWSGIGYRETGKKLAQTLPGDYGIGSDCLRMNTQGGEIEPSILSIEIVHIMKMLISHYTPSTRPAQQVTAQAIDERIDRLPSSYTLECPRDTGKVRAFLSDFGEAAKAMAATRNELMIERETEAKARQEEARMAASRKKEAEMEARRIEEERDLEERRTRAEQVAKRKSELMAGTVQPGSYSDFMILHEPDEGQTLFYSPSLSPSGHVVRLWGFVERQEDGGILLFFESTNSGFVLARTDRKTKFIGDIRIKRVVNVIGRYSENVEYGSAFGARRTVAAIDALVIQASGQ